MAEIQITEAIKVPALDPKRWGQEDWLITYTVDKERIYQTRVPDQPNWQEVAAKQVAEEERQRQALFKKSIRV